MFHPHFYDGPYYGAAADKDQVVEFVRAIRRGKLRGTRAEAQARKIGFGQHAAASVAYAREALRWSRAKRRSELLRVRKAYAAMKGKTGIFPKLYAADREKLRMQVQILRGIARMGQRPSATAASEAQREAIRWEATPGALPTGPAAASASADEGDLPATTESTAFAGIPVWGWAVGAGVLGLIAIAALRPKGGGNSGPRSYRRVR